MMKRLLKFGFYLLLVGVLAVYFAPKRQLYYWGENLLQPYGVVMSGEAVNDRGFSLALQEGTLYYQDLKIATFDEISVLPLLLFNRVKISPFSLADVMQRFASGDFELELYQSVIDPLHVYLQGSGSPGDVQGAADLAQRTLKITLTPSEALIKSNPIWLKELKKQPSGEFVYETAY